MAEQRFRPLVPVNRLSGVAWGVDHPEGICMTPDGTLFVGGTAGQLYRINADDTVTEVATTGGRLLGLAADRASGIYACDMAHRCVWRFDPSDWSRTVFTAGTEDEALLIPNWGAFGPDGTFYVSDSGHTTVVGTEVLAAEGRIFSVRGGVTNIWTREAAHFPNGLAVSPDGSSLFVLESYPGRLVRFEIQPDGTAGELEALVELPEVVPDGLAFATDGSVVIVCYRPDVLLRWHPDSVIEVIVRDLEHRLLMSPTNCVFHGSDLTLVSVPNIDGNFVSRFTVPGLRGQGLFYPAPQELRPT